MQHLPHLQVLRARPDPSSLLDLGVGGVAGHERFNSIKIRIMFETSPHSSANQMPTPLPTPLARALEQNETALDSVEQSAAELVVIHAVLKQEVPDDVQIGEVALALQKTDELEVKISDAAQDLAQVNEVLAQEIDARVNLESELAATKAALAREKAKPLQAV